MVFWEGISDRYCITGENTVLWWRRFVMASLQIRKLPDSLHQKLVAVARHEHRSVPQQTIVLLADALNVSLAAKENRKQVLATIKRDAKRLKKFDVSDPTDLIRQDRL